MAYAIKSRSTNLLVCLVPSVEEALIAEAAGLRADGTTDTSIRELAEARVKESPDYNSLPAKDERFVRYTTKAGRMIICEVVRLFCPDEEGYPQYVELINMARPDGSFCVQASGVKPVDLNAMTPELANALVQGIHNYDQDGGGNTPKLRHGLKR